MMNHNIKHELERNPIRNDWIKKQTKGLFFQIRLKRFRENWIALEEKMIVDETYFSNKDGSIV